MADHYCFAKIQCLHHRVKVVGVAIHVVVPICLLGAAVTATVYADASVAAMRQEEHLRIPGIRIERPAMGKCDDRAGAPVFVEDPCAVEAGHCTHCHISFRSFVIVGWTSFFSKKDQIAHRFVTGSRRAFSDLEPKRSLVPYRSRWSRKTPRNSWDSAARLSHGYGTTASRAASRSRAAPAARRAPPDLSPPSYQQSEGTRRHSGLAWCDT